MSKDTKKLVGIIAIGVIAYELWKRQQFAAGQGQGQGFTPDLTSPIPVWTQQLSASTTETTTTETSIIDSLMGLPQGPGGTSNYYGGAGYFGGAACLLPPGA